MQLSSVCCKDSEGLRSVTLVKQLIAGLFVNLLVRNVCGIFFYIKFDTLKNILPTKYLSGHYSWTGSMHRGGFEKVVFTGNGFEKRD